MLLPFVIFLITSFLIGIHSSSRIGGKVRNFYVAGNIIPAWVLVLSMTGQAIEIGGTQDNATFAMQDGFWAGAILPVGIGLSLIFIGLFFAKPLHRMHLLTLPDYYFRRYNRQVELIVSFLCVGSFMILIAGNLAGAGIIIHFTLGLSPTSGLFIVGLPVMLYTMAGGLFAVTWNDVLHMGVAFIGFAAAFLYFLCTIDWPAVSSLMTQKVDWSVFSSLDRGSLQTWASLLALALGDIVAIDFMERVFAAKTPHAAQNSCLLAGVITILVGVVLAFIGMMASTSSVEGAGEDGLLSFIINALPAGIAMMVCMGLIAACVSTIDGAIMASAVVITKNIVQQNFPRLIPSEKLLLFSRLMAIPVTIGSIIIAIIRPVPGDLLILAFDVVFAGCLVPLALGVYWSRGTSKAALWAIVIPSALRIVLHFLTAYVAVPSQLKGIETLIPPVVSLVLFVSISLWGQPRLTEDLNHG